MATKYVLGSMVAATVVAFSLDYLIADKKIFGGTTQKLWLLTNGGRNRKEVSGMASNCWTTNCNEPHQSPKFHC
ncbi:hypothetical protein MRB53_007884 [Persea americana]|uniref:Uncharacterized protein n=1 Tax=Persea americana TaxID=3435 RepID=A0ACC2MK49_PERAE|nr:hypothetical protein MRB53_007884 [Persea americana]